MGGYQAGAFVSRPGELDFYPGRLTLIRAAVRERWPGEIEDDPETGMGQRRRPGYRPCRPSLQVSETLDERYAPTLAALLGRRRPNVPSPRPILRQHET